MGAAQITKPAVLFDASAAARPRAVQARRATRACGVCGCSSRKMFRVKPTGQMPWMAACPLCTALAMESDPSAAYGGQVSAVLRRRRRAG